jgi:hypothetical protein
MPRIQLPLVLSVALAIAVSGCSTKASMVPHITTPTAPTTQTLYVANFGNNDILEFPITASGNAAPATMIGGGSSPLLSPRAIAVNAQGEIFSSVQTISGYDGIAGFAPTASGSATPTQVLAGSATTFNNGITSLAFDPTGKLYIADYPDAAVAIFAAGAAGNTAPFARITASSGAIASAGYATVDASGKVYVVNNNAITICTLTGAGQVASSATLTPPANVEFGSVTVGPSGLIYATDTVGPGVYVYAAGSTGNASPLQTISGSNTGLSSPTSIAIDASGRIYVSNDPNGLAQGASSINVFAAGATGNATPLATIVGPNTTLNNPAQIAIH